MLQSMLLEMSQNYQTLQYYPDGFLTGILAKLEVWPIAPTFTEQENRALQVLFEGFDEAVKPYPYPYSPLTFSQDTRQVVLVESILAKVKAAQ